MELQRQQKDTEIQHLVAEAENNRITYETKINELEVQVKDFHIITIKLGATITELEARLGEKEDVQEQLDSWMAAHEQIRLNKEDL